jgi:20S proteasome subunit beta 6
VIATSGMLADQLTLHKTLKARMVFYKQQHRKEMTTPSVAQMLSNTLYYKRFFPYYTFNIIAGLDEEGKGAVYGYDAVGSYQRVPVVCQGTGHELIQPVVDNQIDRKHQAGKGLWEISEEDAISLVQDSFTSAGERDIYTGDSVDIAIINKDGIRWEKFELKKD